MNTNGMEKRRKQNEWRQKKDTVRMKRRKNEWKYKKNSNKETYWRNLLKKKRESWICKRRGAKKVWKKKLRRWRTKEVLEKEIKEEEEENDNKNCKERKR